MEQYISKATLVAEIERLHKEWRWYSSTEAKYRCEVYRELSEFLDTIEVKELPINHDERFTTITDIAKFCFEHGLKAKDVNEIIKTAEDHAYFAGSENTRKNLWHPADGDDLPEIDREVIALLEDGKVVFAHRPPEYWDGKNILTGKVTRYYPKRYDVGGWNQSNVKWWLDLDLPKMQE